MEKKNKSNFMKIVKILTISSLIILVSMIGFVGIYKQDKNQIKNQVKDYSYAMDINGTRTVKLALNTESKEVIKDKDGNIVESATDEEIQKNGYTKENVPYNKEDVKTEENYNKVKEIIEKRLKKSDVQDYNVSVNSKNGEIKIELPEDDNTDKVVSNLTTIGKFEIIDSDTKEVLLDNSNVKSADVLYNNTSSGNTVYLEIAFNKDGKNKLEEISKTYVKSEDENTVDNTTSENETTEENETTNEATAEETETDKKITMKIDDEEIMTTSFDEPLTTGKIQLSVGSATTSTTTFQKYMTQAKNVAISLDAGNLPIKYNIEKNQFVLSTITEQKLNCIELIIAIIAVVGILVLIFKYKSNGLLAGIAYVGLAAVYLLLVRYANVLISVESIFGIAIVLILNYIFTVLLLGNIEKFTKENKENIVNKASLETYKKFFNRIIPICIMVVAFCFIKWTSISSFGMILFWGLTIIAIYNAVVTRILLKIKAENK